MPFCPGCRFEYLPGLAHCPECGAELVATLPPKSAATEGADFTPVELCTITGEIHARLIQNILAHENIPSRLVTAWPFDGASPLSPPWPFGGGFDTPVRIMVNQSDLAKAKVIYEDFEHSEAGRGKSTVPEE
ncbi:MAG: DUF2007 domain-containing protein [Armatimonadetes bacterium]|nr:DUF2007 domain-containing protein [Armatimonadota bacterium]